MNRPQMIVPRSDNMLPAAPEPKLLTTYARRRVYDFGCKCCVCQDTPRHWPALQAYEVK